MLSSPVGEFVSELQTFEIPEGIMKRCILTRTTEDGEAAGVCLFNPEERNIHILNT
jgi:hypothetical protein